MTAVFLETSLKVRYTSHVALPAIKRLKQINTPSVAVRLSFPVSSALPALAARDLSGGEGVSGRPLRVFSDTVDFPNRFCWLLRQYTSFVRCFEQSCCEGCCFWEGTSPGFKEKASGRKSHLSWIIRNMWSFLGKVRQWGWKTAFSANEEFSFCLELQAKESMATTADANAVCVCLYVSMSVHEYVGMYDCGYECVWVCAYVCMCEYVFVGVPRSLKAGKRPTRPEK